MRSYVVAFTTILLLVLFFAEEGTPAPPAAKKQCKVKDINVQKNFDLKRFQGHWYDFSRVELARDTIVLSSGVSEYTLQPDGELRIEYGGETKGRCIRPLVASGQQNSNISAKLTVNFADMPDFFLRGPFWVIETNYEHAVIYSCYKLRPDGTCDSDEELVYILSRKRTLPDNIIQRVGVIARTRLCIDLTRLKRTEYNFPCPPDPRYDPQKYLERVIPENNLDVTTDNAYNVSLIEPPLTSSVDLSTAGAPLYTEGSLTNDEPVSFVDEPSEFTLVLSEEQVAVTEGTAEDGTGFAEGVVDPTAEGSLENSTAIPPSETSADLLDTPPVHEDINTTATTLQKRCHLSEIPTQSNFELDKFLGQWFLMASYSTISVIVDSATAVLTKSHGDVISTAFTGYIGGECMGTVRGYLRATVEDPATLQANYATLSGPFKIVYINENYTSALVYQCNQSSVIDGVCHSIAIDVLSRTRHMSADDMNDVVRHIDDVCIEVADFVTIKHEVECEVEPLPKSGPLCKVDSFQAQQDIDWSRFAGKWYTVSRLKRRFAFESGTWLISDRINGNISASYIAARHGVCLPPVRPIWTPAIDKSGNFLVSYEGISRLGKIVFTDYQVALYYECDQLESDGTCAVTSNVRLEVWQRNTDVMGNILIRFGQVIRDLCVNPARLQVVSHDVSCEVPPQCSMPDAMSLRDDMRTKLVRKGRWKPWLLFTSEESSRSRQQLNELMFSAVGSNGTIVVCFTTTNREKVCQSTECVTIDSLFTSNYQRFTMDDNGRSGHATTWRVVHFNDLYLVLYICHKVVDGRGRGGVCDPSAGRLYVLGSGESVLGDSLPARLQPALDKMCLSRENRLNITVSCPVEVPPYSIVIDTLPVFESVNVPQMMGVWYSVQATGFETVSKVSKLRLSVEPSGKVDIVFANSINGTCQPSKRYLATKVDDRGADWLILTFDRQSGHLRILYMDQDIAVVYFCQRLQSRGICYPNESLVLLMSKAPVLTEERRGTIQENLRAHQYDSIDDVIIKAGFRNVVGSNISFTGAVSCVVHIDENLCPIESLPVVKKLHFKKFLGHWFVVSRLQNSPSFDTAELRFSPGEETSIVYVGTKNGSCQRPLRGKLVPLPDGLDSQFEVDYGNGHVGRFQVIYTNYRSALVYQCLQVLGDGACLPGQVVVELLSRTVDISPRIKVPLLKRTKDLCVDPEDMKDTTYNNECSEESSASCYVDDFPKDVTFTKADFLGNWFVIHEAKRIRGFEFPSSIRILTDSDPNRFRYISQFTRDGNCYSIESHLVILSSEAPYHMAFDFKENNALLRVIEAGYGMMLAYVCKYLESDGRCRPDHGGVLILSRTLNDVAEELLVHYTDLFPDLCLDSTDELIRVSPSDCKSGESVRLDRECDIKSVDIRPQYASQMVDVEWHLAGRLKGGLARPNLIKYHISRHSKSGQLVVHFTATKDGNCLPTTKVLATLTRDGSYDILYNNEHVEFFIIFADAELSIIYSCQSYDSFGRCDPRRISIELFTRNASLPDLAKAKLYEIELNWCFTPENFVSTSSDGVDCPLLIEPECSIDVPLSQSTIDISKVGGYWYAVATQSGRNLPRVSAIDIELSADQTTMTTHTSSSQNGRCLPTFKTTVVNASPNNFRWRLQTIGLTGYLLLVYVDDDYLVLLECLSSGLCTPDSVSSIDLYARRRSALDDVDKRKLAKVFRRICYDIDNFTFLLSDVECVVEGKHSLMTCSLDERGLSYVIMPQLSGTWYAGAKLKRSEVAESEVVRITGHELMSVPSYTATYTGSRRGECLTPVRGRLVSQRGENDGSIKITYEDSSTVEWSILFTDYRYLVTMECRDLGINDSCRADNAMIAMYTREPVDISSIIGELIRVVGLDDCLRANDFISISHEVPCSIVSPNCVLLPRLPLRDNFSTDGLLGVWHSLYHLRSLGALDSYTIRFHRDDASGSVIGYFTGSHNRDCQPAVNFAIPDNSRDWTISIGDKQARMKVLAVDETHVILYQCLDYDTSQATCRTDATHINVLSHERAEDLSASVITWAADAVHQTCIEFGDMDHTHHSISCPLPIVKRTGCLWNRMPVASNIDYNKLGGVWYSYLLLKGSAVDFSTTILQWSRGTSFAAIFRSSRQDECLAVQTGAVSPRTDDAFKADFDARFRTYSGEFRVLYTDYSYALMYTCTAELDNGQCPAVHRQVSINGRLKTGQLPPDVRKKMFSIASDACLYEEDFVEATHYAECDLPYSGRHSCRLDDVITHDAFDVREMFGNWQLLSRTTNMNSTFVAESIRFSPGVGGIIKFIISGEDSVGLCQRVDGTIESVANQNSTFTFSENDGDTHLMKVLFMNSQYLITYVCHGPLPTDLEVCDENREEVMIFGRTSVMSASVRKMLTDIVWPRICLNLNLMIDVNYNNKCDLPPNCDIRDFIVQENFEPQMVTGTWQVLVRSSFRQSSTLPSTAKFFQTLTSAINMVRVVNQSGNYCHSENLLLRPTDGPAGVYQTLPDVETAASSTTMFLYVMDDYFVTLDCIGATSSEGDCTADKVELTIWGRTWDLSSSLRRTLLQEIRDRTLRCYAIHAMVDVQANEICELPSSACDMNQYMLEKDFDGRLLLGQWYLVARSSLYSSMLRIGDMRVALSGQTYHIVIAGRHDDGNCFEMSSSMKVIPGMNSTFLFTSDNIQSLTQIVYWSEEYLIRLDCIGMSSPLTYCHPERTGLQLFSRWDYMDDDKISQLARVTRERTQSCVATSGLEALPLTEDICPNSAPPEGSESCSIDGIELGKKLDLQQLNGIWFQVLRTNRVRELHWDGGVYHFNVKNKTITIIYAGHPSFKRNGHCFVESTEAIVSMKDNTEWHTVIYGHNDTMKIIDIGDDHLVTYECFDNQFTNRRHCRPEFEHLEVFHRRRQINNQHQHQLLSIISQKTCFEREELIRANHSRKCEIPGILELDYLKGKPCDVETYPAISDFEAQRFVGIWHEVERTRYSHGNLWESGIFNFSLDATGLLGFLYSGTKGGHCLGPIEGHSRPVHGGLRYSDLTVWIGPQQLSHHPWTVHYRFKIVYTDYENVAVIYSCHSMTDDGICHKTSEQVFVLSRSQDLETVSRDRVYSVIRDSICVDINDFVKAGYEANCHDFVDGSHEEITRLVRERYVLQRRSTVEPEEPSTMIPPPTQHECPMVLCANHCPNGYARNEYGCETCTCEVTEDLTTSNTTDADVVEWQITHPPLNVKRGYESTNSPVECAIPMCLNFCEHGYALDERGCETCNCSPAPTDPPPGENDFNLDNSALGEGEVTDVTTTGDDEMITEDLVTGVPTETSIQETPTDIGSFSEVEGTVEEIDLPDVHPVFSELRKTRTADGVGTDANQLHPQEERLSNIKPVTDQPNKTHEVSTESNTKEPASNEERKTIDEVSDESKKKEQDKVSSESMEPDDNTTIEPDGSEPNTAEPALQAEEEDDVWTGLFKFFNP